MLNAMNNIVLNVIIYKKGLKEAWRDYLYFVKKKLKLLYLYYIQSPQVCSPSQSLSSSSGHLTISTWRSIIYLSNI